MKEGQRQLGRDLGPCDCETAQQQPEKRGSYLLMHSTSLSEKTFPRNAPVDLFVSLINQNWSTHPCLHQSLPRGMRHHDGLTPVVIHHLRIKLLLSHERMKTETKAWFAIKEEGACLLGI